MYRGHRPRLSETLIRTSSEDAPQTRVSASQSRFRHRDVLRSAVQTPTQPRRRLAAWA